MSNPQQVAYKFGRFCLRPGDRQLLCDDNPVPLAPKMFDTLLLLVESQGRLLEKDEFLKRVWPDSFVEEVALAHAISHVRKALREGTGESSFIETVPKRGYRFLARVEILGAAGHEAALPVRLAVLPFENLGADPELEYMADGLTEEVIAALGHVDPGHLSVIGRTSVMAYKRTTKLLADIGRELGARFLVESSLRGEKGRLRIISKLIRAHDQVQIWSASYDSEPGSVLDFQRELSGAIAEQVRLRLSPDLVVALAGRQTRHAEAYDLYLRGRYFWNQLSAPGTRRAVEFFTRATELDPGYALAWSGLATAWASGPISGDAPPLQLWPRSREASAHAVAGGSGLAEVQTSLGMLKFWLDWDWCAAESALRKALDLDPSYSQAQRLLGIALSHMGRNEEGQEAARRARELDPLDATHHVLSAQVAFNARDSQAAIRFAGQARSLDPHFWVAYYQLALAHEQAGENEAALDALRQAAPLCNGNSKVIGLRGYVLAKLGRGGEAREVLNTLEEVSRERYVPPYATALIHAGLGERDAAFQWLDRAFEAHDVHLVLIGVDSKWDAFRSDGRLVALLERCAFNAPAVARN